MVQRAAAAERRSEDRLKREIEENQRKLQRAMDDVGSDIAVGVAKEAARMQEEPTPIPNPNTQLTLTLTRLTSSTRS